MAFSCENCGFKTNEVKGGGKISDTGKKLTLKITMPEDLTRDILKVLSYPILYLLNIPPISQKQHM